ncbi:hypothetical protein AC1031_020521 [Aphanomyces cochlioides]|nr:hypothetical protein AC1031_020521 [Aphanomyces cochlioides]
MSAGVVARLGLPLVQIVMGSDVSLVDHALYSGKLFSVSSVQHAAFALSLDLELARGPVLVNIFDQSTNVRGSLPGQENELTVRATTIYVRTANPSFWRKRQGMDESAWLIA